MDFKKNPKTDFKEIKKLSEEEAREEIDALREGIDYHDYLYYVKNEPAISDATYDQLFRRLEKLEEAFPGLQSEYSPTRRVGAEPVDELKEVSHTAPMLSLNATLEVKEVEDFTDFIQRRIKRKKIEYVLEPKFDGFSVEIVFEEGRFKRGATRGDGYKGEDISENLKTVRALPITLRKGENIPSLLAVRGEVFMPKEGFQTLNKKRIERGQEPFANPRNAAAGIMRQLDSKKVADKPFDIFFYDILQAEDGNESSHWKMLKQFRKWGLKVNPECRKCSSCREISKYHEKLGKKREQLAYEIDGIVIKLDDCGLREELGTRHRSPRWALAWKFPPKEEITKLEKIVIQVGRTGILTPVALLRPVDVGGVTVSRATLHNANEVKRKDVRSGDTVRVVRAGDVIPEVVERIKEPGKKRQEPFSMPRSCPVCGARVVREGAYYLCPAGLSCEAQLVGGIIHYASKEALDIQGLGDKTAEDMADKGLVTDIADLYELSVNDLLKLDGFAEKSANQLHDAIQKTKKPRLDRFLYALGIRHVGSRIARLLAKKYRTLDDLRKTSRDDLEKISEIGPEIAQSISAFFAEEENREVLKHLARAGVQPRPVEPEEASLLKDKTLVFTGTLKNLTREEAKRTVEDLGGRATSSVSTNTDYLVAGKNPGSKLDEAKEAGVTILSEDEFEDLIGKGKG